VQLPFNPGMASLQRLVDAGLQQRPNTAAGRLCQADLELAAHETQSENHLKSKQNRGARGRPFRDTDAVWNKSLNKRSMVSCARVSPLPSSVSTVPLIKRPQEFSPINARMSPMFIFQVSAHSHLGTSHSTKRNMVSARRYLPSLEVGIVRNDV
jgi:hypothetical protein